MSREVQLFKTTLLLIFGTFLPRILNLVTTPLLTSYTTDGEFGFINLLTTTILSFVIPICTLQIEQACYRYLKDAKTHKDRVTVITTSFALLIVMMVIAGTICLFIPFGIEISYFNYLLIAYLWIEILVQILRFILRAFGMYQQYTILAALVVIVNFVTLFSCLVIFKLGFMSALIALTVADFVGLIYILWVTKFFQYIKFDAFDKDLLKVMVRYVLPFVPNSIAGYVNMLSDQWIIVSVLGLGANGIYSMANKIPSILNLIYPAFNVAWTDSAVETIKDKDYASYYKGIFVNVFNFLSVSALGLITITPILFDFLNKSEALASAIQYIPILIIAFYFQCFTMFFSSILIALKESKFIYKTTLIAAIVNVILNILFMKKFGIYTAVLSTLISNFILAQLRYKFIDQTICRLKVPKRLIGLTIILFIIVSLFTLSNSIILQVFNYLIVIVFAYIMLSDLIIILLKKMKKKLRG